jgi:hypothetical protein
MTLPLSVVATMFLFSSISRSLILSPTLILFSPVTTPAGVIVINTNDSSLNVPLWLILDNLALCLHNDSMTSILIRDVPPKVHNALQEAAEAKGHSLQQYLVMEIAKIAEKSQIEERLKKLNRAALPKIKASTIVDAINSERSRDR